MLGAHGRPGPYTAHRVSHPLIGGRHVRFMPPAPVPLPPVGIHGRNRPMGGRSRPQTQRTAAQLPRRQRGTARVTTVQRSACWGGETAAAGVLSGAAPQQWSPPVRSLYRRDGVTECGHTCNPASDSTVHSPAVNAGMAGGPHCRHILRMRFSRLNDDRRPSSGAPIVAAAVHATPTVLVRLRSAECRYPVSMVYA